MKKRIGVLGLLIFVLVGLVWSRWDLLVGMRRLSGMDHVLAKVKLGHVWPPKIGEPYPDIEMTDQTGRLRRLSEFKGQIIVVEPVSMDCTACQAWSGAHKVGVYGPARAQQGLLSVQEMFPLYAQIPFEDPRFVFVQLLYFDSARQPTTPEHARLWARHFGMDAAKNRFVWAGSAKYRSPDYDAGTYRQVPGFQVIDRDFILRSDATGHPPTDDMYKTTLPLVGKLVSRAADGEWTKNPKYALPHGSRYAVSSGRVYVISNPGLALNEMLYLKRDFIGIEKRVAGWLSAPINPVTDARLSDFYRDVSENSSLPYADRANVLNDWIHRHPNAHLPWLIRGWVRYAEGWRIRGGGYSSEISEQNAEQFMELVREAQGDFEKAVALNPKDLSAFIGLMETAKCLSLGNRIHEEYFNNALRLFPGSIEAHRVRWHFLLPEWHGSSQQLAEFEEEMRQKLMAYPTLGFALHDAWNWWAHKNDIKNVYQKPEAWKEIYRAFETKIKIDPENWRTRANLAYYAWYAKDYVRGRAQFDAIGDRFPVSSVWQNPEDYDRWRDLTTKNATTGKGDGKIHFGDKTFE